MKVLSCPRCGAPLQNVVPACPYCGVGLIADEPAPRPMRQEPAPPQIPEGWMQYRDAWHGFTIAHPPGWQVVTMQGQISVREDPVGIVSAVIWPFSLQAPGNARQVAQQLTAVARSIYPSFQAWIQDNIAPDSNRVTIRTREVRYSQQLEGIFNILVEGTNVIVSGYIAPTQIVSQRSPLMAQILSSFFTIELMPRQVFQDPTEGAFALYVPQGWMVQGGVNRNHPGGSGLAQLSAVGDAQGLVSAVMPWYLWSYMDAPGGMFGGFGMYQSMRFTPAAQFCQQNLAPWMSQSQARFKVEVIVDRPDLSELFVQELAKSGYPPGSFEVTVAMMETSYDENGVRIRQKSRVNTQRQRSNLFTGATPMWMVGLDVYYRAPEAEFSTWEPVLSGVLDSMKMNPAWQMAERQRMQNQIMTTQMDTSRRLRQISQTLSETSDIINNSY